MKIVHYTKITIEGFQSICKPLTFKLDNVGLNLIKGVNGSGKSTVFNAILWCEYGANMKKSVASWDDVRTDTFRGTRVVLERTDGEFDYMTVRHLAFKGTTKGLSGGDKLMLFKKSVDEPKFEDKHLVGDGLHKADMQAMIEDQLGMDSRTFLSSIIFGQRMASFVETDNKDKRALFEQLFNVAFVEDARLIAKEEETRISTEIGNLETKVEGFETTMGSLQEKLEEQQQVLNDFDTTKKERVKTAEDALTAVKGKKTTLGKEIKYYEEQVAKYDLTKVEALDASIASDEATLKVLKQSRKEAEELVSDIKDEITKSEKKQKEFEKQLGEVDTKCPSCLQDLPADKVDGVKKNISDNIKKEKEVQKTQSGKLKPAEKAFTEADKKYSEVEKRLADTKKEAEKFSTDKTEAATAAANLKNKKDRLVEVEKEIKDAEASLDKEKKAEKPKIDLQATQDAIQELNESMETVEADLTAKNARLKKVQWWITKGFGASGLKAFVFNAMLAQLNAFSHRYSARLGFRVEFSVDMSKASKPFQTLIFKGDSVKDYEDLSGGQKQRVDIVIAFAMHDLISFNSNINILVMDELFEGLDNEGVEAAFELIREKAETKSVYLITHADFVDTLNSRSVTFDLDEEGSTYVKM